MNYRDKIYLQLKLIHLKSLVKVTQIKNRGMVVCNLTAMRFCPWNVTIRKPSTETWHKLFSQHIISHPNLFICLQVLKILCYVGSNGHSEFRSALRHKADVVRENESEDWWINLQFVYYSVYYFCGPVEAGHNAS